MSHWVSTALVLPFSTMLVGMGHIPVTPPPAPKVVLVKGMDVSATEFKWSPADVTVNQGDTIRFEQTTTTPHNVEFKETPAGVDLGDAKVGPFLVAKGDHYDLVIDGRFKPGAYKFACTPHESMGMKGTITVAGGK